MIDETSYPHITVAAIAERNGKFLFVKEETAEGVVLNQPAGHLELGETLVQAVVRETLEETAWSVEPISFLGVDQHTSPHNSVTYIRHTFLVTAVSEVEDVVLDDGILEALWLSPEDAFKMPLRSPLVVQSIQRFLSGERYPLDIFRNTRE